MEAGPRGIVADLDFRIRQRGQLIDGLHFRRTHIRGGNNPQQPTSYSELFEGVDNQPQSAPFHKGYQHVDPVCTGNLFLQLGKHFRFVGCAGK